MAALLGLLPTLLQGLSGLFGKGKGGKANHKLLASIMDKSKRLQQQITGYQMFHLILQLIVNVDLVKEKKFEWVDQGPEFEDDDLGASDMLGKGLKRKTRTKRLGSAMAAGAHAAGAAACR